LCNSAASQGFGHVSIALSEGSNGALKLYSFYGIGSSSQSSSGSGFTPKVATIDPDYSPVTFDDLKNASGAIRQGIPEDYWVEEYSGYIILRIFSIVQYQRMLDHATDTVDYPPIYNLLNYNCYHYVYTVLGYGSIHLLNSANQPVWDIIPNDAFNNASHVSIGAEWIEKGYF
jgi:hypothetical protein